jgi:hypothetical protein
MPEETFEEKRTDKFKWHSKQELCDYFERRHGLSKKLVNSEIGEAMKGFRLRTGKAIQTIELWQKVGMSLERKLAEFEEEQKST